MRKLKLDLATLTVESFRTELTAPSEGTVFGYSGGSCNTYDEATCGYNYSCPVIITLPECPTTNAQVVYWIAPPDDEATSCCTAGGCPLEVQTSVCGG